jgi:hypothetical protein
MPAFMTRSSGQLLNGNSALVRLPPSSVVVYSHLFGENVALVRQLQAER